MYFKRAKRSIKTIIYIYPFKKSNISKVCNFYKHMCEHFKIFFIFNPIRNWIRTVKSGCKQIRIRNTR